jgi:hypothetical protein
VFVKKDALRWISGKEHVALHQPPAPFKYGRCFCKLCGTSLGEILSEEDSFPIAANAFDSDVGLKVQFDEHVEDKPGWMA